jgi:hypothetical protein
MAFWSDGTQLDPKRQFKFRVTFGLLGTNAQFIAQSADRPTFTITDTTKVDFLDKSFHFPGKITWNPIKIKFVDTDVEGINTSRQVYDYLANSGWISPDKVAVVTPNYRTINKSEAKGAGQTDSLLIEVLASSGATVDKWKINNAFISTVALNNLDYAAEGILTAEFTFRYDWAEFLVS